MIVEKLYGKMLKNLLIISLCFVAINAYGEFSVLNSPKSLSFKGSDVLQSQDVGEVLYTAMGNPVTGDAQWSGLIIKDPFNLPKGIVAVLVEGTDHISLNSKVKTFELAGDTSRESLNGVSAELESNNVPVCDIDFSEFDEALIVFRSCFGDVPTLASDDTKSLNPSLYTGDKQFVQTIGLLNFAANNLAAMEKASNFLVLRVSLDSIAKAHGEKSDAMTEATKMLSAAISKLSSSAEKSSNSGALVVAIANKLPSGRSKREVVTPSTDNSLNLAEYYNQDYPVVFNIILWFMVVFGLSLLAICYAIGSMDPGRDSIIYRMTSTRMKKDN